MSFDWREYLELAKELVGLKGSLTSSEAAYRTAVSRAYYAAFCWARNYAAMKLEFRPTKGSEDHRLLRKHFSRKGYGELASHLNKLRKWRNECEYEDNVSDLSYHVKYSMDLAARIIQKCQ